VLQVYVQSLYEECVAGVCSVSIFLFIFFIQGNESVTGKIRIDVFFLEGRIHGWIISPCYSRNLSYEKLTN
jgi:hypothetical protein